MPDPSQPQTYEIRPDPQSLTQNTDPEKNSSTGVDYEPHPESSIKLEPERQRVVDSICRLYSGSASEDDMQVYAEMAVYDDPWSYCDTRYKIAGQWYGEFDPNQEEKKKKRRERRNRETGREREGGYIPRLILLRALCQVYPNSLQSPKPSRPRS